jgi:DEAD/DEAH box helicase domain-containing protein
VPGGIGLAARLFEVREELVRRARSLALGCGCATGCPACIGPELGQGAAPNARPAGHEQTGVSRKRVIADLLEVLGFVSTH